MLRYITEVVLPSASADRPALVFTHGLAIKCLLRGLMESTPAFTRRIRLVSPLPWLAWVWGWADELMGARRLRL